MTVVIKSISLFILTKYIYKKMEKETRDHCVQLQNCATQLRSVGLNSAQFDQLDLVPIKEPA